LRYSFARSIFSNDRSSFVRARFSCAFARTSLKYGCSRASSASIRLHGRNRSILSRTCRHFSSACGNLSLHGTGGITPNVLRNFLAYREKESSSLTPEWLSRGERRRYCLSIWDEIKFLFFWAPQLLHDELYLFDFSHALEQWLSLQHLRHY